MKKSITLIILITGIFILAWLLPWWASVIWILCVTWMSRMNTSSAILSGGIALGATWLFMSAFMLTQDPSGIVGKTGQLMGGLSTPVMLIITVFIGTVTGMLSGWLGSALSQIRIKKE
jgi:hypothetical protein